MQKFKRMAMSLCFLVVWGCSSTPPTSTATNPSATDVLIRSGVVAQIREKDAYSKACFDSEYKDASPKPEGYVVLRMTLNEDGDVRTVETAEDTFHNSRLENCLKYIVKTIRFDHTGVTLDTIVDYPFVFRNPVENFPKP